VACPEREARLKGYRDAVQAYAKAVLCLDGDLTPKELEVAHKGAEKARAEFDRTRKEIEGTCDLAWLPATAYAAQRTSQRLKFRLHSCGRLSCTSFGVEVAFTAAPSKQGTHKGTPLE
jgi:hypothetical protein